MAESELKLDVPCPWCGTPNGLSASQCRQCYQDLPQAERAVPAQPSLFELSRPAKPCPACGKSNLLNGDRCFECGETLVTEPAGGPLKAAIKARRKRWAIGPIEGWFKVAWLLRLGSVLYLFWSLFDTSSWLTASTSSLAPADPAAIRLNLFAIFEALRNGLLVAGVWLLTCLQVGRSR